MIQVNATSGNQVDGIRIKDQLETDLYPTLSDQQKVVEMSELLILGLATSIRYQKNLSWRDAIEYVLVHTERIT